MKKVLALTLGAILSTQAGVVSAEEGKAGTGPNPFTDCGIGAALFPDTHWAAVTSNIIWDVGTTAVTSATASPETCSGKNVEVAQFISTSYDNLVEDTARGEGEYVTAMLDIYGCSATGRTEVTSEIRAQVGESVGSDEYNSMTNGQKAESYYLIVNDVVTSSPAGTCAA